MFTRTRYQQGSLTKEERSKGPDAWVFRWRAGGVHHKQIIGTVDEFPSKSSAMKVVEGLRIQINRETWIPTTMDQLVEHFRQTELAEDNPRRSYSTKAAYGCYLDNWVLPKWGRYPLGEIRTTAVEEWLQKLELANGTKAKIRNIMSALFNHAMRNDWYGKNPIKLVRQSAKRERIPDVLTNEEIKSLLAELEEPYKTMVFMACITGLRVSELLALRWGDIDWQVMEIHLRRGIVYQQIGELKTEASKKPVPMSESLCSVLRHWHALTSYGSPQDWIFASPEMDGLQPYWPDSLRAKVIRPAAIRAKITKRVGWHTFRHTCGTLLKANGEDVKTVQESLRHANSRITLDTYTQGLMPIKRAAQSRLTEAIQ